jgi:hypothetical protein
LKDKIFQAEKEHNEDKKETEILLKQERLKNAELSAKLSVLSGERDENKAKLEELAQKLKENIEK